MESVQKIVDFKLQKMIHCTDEKHEMYTEIAEMANAVANIGRNVQVAAKPVLENPESIGMIMNILKKMNESKMLNAKAIRDVMVDTVMDVQKRMAGKQ